VTALRTANLALKFLLELAALAALAVTGLSLDAPLLVRVAVAIVAPLVAALVWARWCAPRSPRRLATMPRIIVELVVLLGSAACLALVGDGAAAAVLSGLVVINLALLFLLGDLDA
jgi:Protein of unknown function (DUF2568)